MIDDENKVIFISIPRTGGHTVSQLFDNKTNTKLVGGRHSLPIKFIKIYPEKWDEYFKFVFVRNPFDRLVSAWSRLNRRKILLMDLNDDNNWIKIKKEFNEFVIKRLKDESKYNTHFIPMIRWFDLNNYKEYDFIGRFENFENDLNKVFEMINYQPKKDIFKYARSNRREYSDYYDKKMIKIVNEIYFEDLNNFNYKL